MRVSGNILKQLANALSENGVLGERESVIDATFSFESGL
jgi:hypothetical protein